MMIDDVMLRLTRKHFRDFGGGGLMFGTSGVGKLMEKRDGIFIESWGRI